jgi:GNAT superfamily N-acetyltransferase
MAVVVRRAEPSDRSAVWMIDDCRRRGARRIFLETERPNESARRLYARHGFTPDDSIWMSLDL